MKTAPLRVGKHEARLRRNGISTVVAFASLSLVALLPTPAHAQDIDGAFRLALDSSVISYTHSTQSAGDGVDTKSSRTSLGLSVAALGAGIGYGATGNVVVGGRVLASTSHSKLGEATADVAGFLLLPHAAYLFLDGAARPFVALHAGVSTGSSSSAGVDGSTTAWLVGPGAGVHAFLAPSVSIDLGLQALFETGTSRVVDASVSTTGYSIALTVGLSGWLGTGQKTARAAEPEQQPVPTIAPAPPTTLVTSNFTLDLPDGLGGLQVALKGEPTLHADQVQVSVTWRRSEKRQRCEAVAFEAEQATTPLTDVRSTAGGGFSANMESQAGSVPIATLRSLVHQEQEAWLTLCHERIVISPAAKRRVERFVNEFQDRLDKEH